MIQESLVRVVVTEITVKTTLTHSTIARIRAAAALKVDTVGVNKEKGWDLKWEKNATTTMTTNNKSVQIILLCAPLKMKWSLS